MKIDIGTVVWVVIDNNGKVLGVWNSLYHAEQQCKRCNLDIEKNIKTSVYLGGV